MVFGKVRILYSISIPIEETREITRLLADATANLNQIAKYFTMGGLRSKEVQEQINMAVENIFNIRRIIRSEMPYCMLAFSLRSCFFALSIAGSSIGEMI